MTFTIGRGNDLCCAAIEQLAPLVVGRELEEIVGRRRGVLAPAHQRRAAPMARAGEGRHPPRDRRARERGVGPLGARSRASRCGNWSATSRPSSSSPHVDFRYLTDVLDRDEALDLLRALDADARATRRRARARRLSGVPHVGGLARVRRGEGARPVPRRARRRVALLQDQGRPRRRGRRPPVRGDARGDRRPPADGRRQPGVGRRRGDRADAAPRAVRPPLDRGADEPRRRARPRGDPPRGRARSASRRASTPRTAWSSSSCCRPKRSTTARSTRAGSAASTRCSRCCCSRPSSASRCARMPAASVCASTCSTCA